MKRRTAFLLALLPFVRQTAVHAQRNPFPLAPGPNPSASCAPPFSRMRDPIDPDLFERDLLAWQHDNAAVKRAYVLLHESQVGLLPAGGYLKLNGCEFSVEVVPGLPADALWGIMADCGQVY